MINFRKATLEDVDQIVAIADEAKGVLKSRGINQWQAGSYPSRENFEQDIADGACYVLEEDDEILVMCSILFDEEPAYRNIENGEWLSGDDAFYATLHRGAVSKKHQGRNLILKMFTELIRIAKENSAEGVRGDTHPDNRPMRSLLEKMGFKECGIIYLTHGDEVGALRLAYELLIPTKK